MAIHNIDDKTNILGDMLTKAQQRGQQLQFFNSPQQAAQNYREKAQGFKNDPGTISAGQQIHGNTGLFATPGLDQNILSRVLRPLQGLPRALSVQPFGTGVPAEYGGSEAPLYATVTGITDPTEVTYPVDICDDQPEGGLVEACVLTAPYGQLGSSISIKYNEVGRLQNRGEETDLRVINAPDPYFNTPATTPNLGGDALMNELNARLIASTEWLGREMARNFIWTGDPSTTTNEGWQQFMGMEMLVNTNKYDINGTRCEAMDSYIENFQYELVNGTGRDIAAFIDDMYFDLSYLADNTGMSPVQWVLVMRTQLFNEITKVYPIKYFNEALANMAAFKTDGGRSVLNASELTDMRDRMREQRMLPVRGKMVPVILDDTIPEDNSTTSASLSEGQFASDVYMLPLTVRSGNFPVLYWEFFKLNNGQANNLKNQMRDNTTYFTDNGRFQWFANFRNGCYRLNFVSRPRIILRAPYLAARLQNVSYEPQRHVDSWNPESDYFVSGGRTNTDQSQYYTEYAQNTPVAIG